MVRKSVNSFGSVGPSPVGVVGAELAEFPLRFASWSADEDLAESFGIWNFLSNDFMNPSMEFDEGSPSNLSTSCGVVGFVDTSGTADFDDFFSEFDFAESPPLVFNELELGL